MLFPAAERAASVVGVDLAGEMVEATAATIAARGLASARVEVGDAERLELPAASFDAVFCGFAIFFLDDPDAALAAWPRVLRPGGIVAFCGEPSRHGDRISALPKRGAYAAAPLWRALMGAAERGAQANGAGPREEDRLEHVVDVHAFTPSQLSAHARAAGLESVRVSGEELAASLFGWVNRTLEGTVEPSAVPHAWRVYAHRGYLLLQRLDRALLEPRLPAALFYNLLVSARAPG